MTPTTAPRSAGAQARRAIEEGCDLVVAAGGDGTINEVITGMLHSEVPLAILPGGTANVLAREIQLPISMTRVASSIQTLKRCRIASGAIETAGADSRAFVCMAGIGLDAEIVCRLNLDLKAAAGKLAYYVAGFSQVLYPLREFEIVIDGRKYEASFALVSRVRNYGGDLEIARRASLLRDDFEIVLFRGTISLRYIAYLLGVAVRQVHRVSGCTLVRGQTVSCAASDNSEIFVQVDGELHGKLPAKINVVPNAFTLLVPPNYLAQERTRVSASAYAPSRA